jgi:hypothetical protein
MLREPVPYEAIARSIQTRHLQTPLERTLSFAPTEPRGKAAARLQQENFDYAPVMDGPRVLGRVARISLDAQSNEPSQALWRCSANGSSSARMPISSASCRRWWKNGSDSEADLVADANLSDLLTISAKSVLHRRLGSHQREGVEVLQSRSRWPQE